jgi:hypothetical protein
MKVSGFLFLAPYYFSVNLILMPFFLFYSDELTAFEESWRNARDNLPGWDPGMNMLGNSTAPLPPSLPGTFTHNHFFFIPS